MNHAMCASSVTALCLFYVISLTGCPLTGAAYSLRHELEQDQIESLLSHFSRSRDDEDDNDWTKLEMLKERWGKDPSQNKRRENVRRHGKACNPITGRCSAGWKRSPSVPFPPPEAAADLDARSIDLPQIISSPYQASKRGGVRPQFSERRKTGGDGYPRSLRRSKCNHLNGRCSAGWKRSPTSSDFQRSLGDDGMIIENVFDILGRLQDDQYRQRMPNVSV